MIFRGRYPPGSARAILEWIWSVLWVVSFYFKVRICDEFCKKIFWWYLVHVYIGQHMRFLYLSHNLSAALSFHQPWHCPRVNSVGSVEISCVHRFAKFTWKLSCNVCWADPVEMRHILFFHLPVSLRQDGPFQWRIYRGFALTPFETELFNFHREFSEKSEKLINKHVTNRTPL